MARLRQYFASRYASTEATSSEFENIIRYLNSAELGNLTLAELLVKLFDDNGDLSLNVNFRFDAATGLEFRLDETAEWTLIVPAADMRGAAGMNVGTIEAPLFFNRQDFTAGAAQTVYAYTIVSEAASVLVWINGVLQGSSSYTFSKANSTVTLASAATTGALVTLSCIRTSPATAYRRADMTAATNQVTFPFPHGAAEEVVVFRNGIMQREGGSYDFIKSWQTSTVTMTTAQTSGTLITVICITNDLIRDVAGLMLEDAYCTNGLIRLNKVSIADGALPQAKVSGLAAALTGKPNLDVSPSAPTGTLTAGSLWVNTSGSVPALMFYDGVRWLSSSPNGMIPLPQTSNALQYVRLNSTATALEYAALDTSALMPTNSRGAANGVAPLDASGLLPGSVLPAWVARTPIIGVRSGSVANGTYVIGTIEDLYVFDGLTLVLSTGSASVQLVVGGVNVGGLAAVTTSISKLNITTSVRDASTTPMVVSLVVSGAAGAADLAYNVGCLIAG